MSSDGPHDHELESLVDALREDELTAVQAARLEELVRSDQAARRLYIRLMSIHTGLYWNHTGVSPVSARELLESISESTTAIHEGDAPPELKPRRPPESFWQRSADRLQHDWSLRMLVSLLLTVTAITALIAWIKPEPIDGLPSARVAETDVAGAAKLVHTIGAVWNDDSDVRHDREVILEDQVIDLADGLAEIEFADGATAVLEGPAECVVHSSGECSLRTGKLTARVPRHAHGFAVSTRAGRIVDLGTEFGVEMNSAGDLQMHVFAGEIEFQPAGGGEMVALRAGEALRVAKSGQPKQLAPEPDRFVRKLPGADDVREARFQTGTPAIGSDKPYQGVEDVMLLEWARDANFGGRADFDVGNAETTHTARSLIRFDLTPLAGRVLAIQSVVLRLTVNHEIAYYPWAGSGSVEVYRLTDANADWRPGNFRSASQPGNPAAGDATWDRRNHPDRGWAGDYGAGAPGVDYHTNMLGRRFYAPSAQGKFDLPLRGDLSFLNNWIRGKGNTGFLLKDSSENIVNRINFHSSEADDVSVRPELIIRYLPRVRAEIRRAPDAQAPGADAPKLPPVEDAPAHK